MARPTTLPRWAEAADGTAAANITEPSSGEKDAGYGENAVPTSGGFNWILRTIYQWIKWAGKGAPVDPDDLARKAETDAVQGNLTAHVGAAVGAHSASAISCAATGDVAATNVQAAIAELASEKARADAMAAADGALDARLDTLEGQNLDARITAIEDANGTTWGQLTLMGGGQYLAFQGFAQFGGGSWCLAKKNGIVIFSGKILRLYVSSGSPPIPAHTVIGVIPAGFRPQYTFADAKFWRFGARQNSDFHDNADGTNSPSGTWSETSINVNPENGEIMLDTAIADYGAVYFHASWIEGGATPLVP